LIDDGVQLRGKSTGDVSEPDGRARETKKKHGKN